MPQCVRAVAVGLGRTAVLTACYDIELGGEHGSSCNLNALEASPMLCARQFVTVK